MKQKTILITMILLICFTFSAFSNQLEYKPSFSSRDFIFESDDQIISGHIFTRYFKVNRHLKMILSNNEESYKALSTARNLEITGRVFYGVFLASLIGPSFGFSYSLSGYYSAFGTLAGYTPTDTMAIVGFVFSGVSIAGLITWIICEIMQEKQIEKAFKIYNEANEKKEEMSLLLDVSASDVQLGMRYRF